MTEQRNIVVLGASAAGLQSSHYVLKHILPALKAKNEAKYHVYLVAPSAHFYFRVASPRVAASNKRMAAEKIVFDLHKSFARYSPDDFTFVEASATGLDTAARTVSYRNNKSVDEQRLSYHALVVATGSKTYHPAFSANTNIQETLDALKDTNVKVEAARKIVIVGGGPTGVEFAGEVGEHRNGKPGWFGKSARKVEVTLITADSKLLPTLRPAISKAAEEKLAAVGVDVKYNTRVIDTSSKDGLTVLTLNSGEKIETDYHVPAYGIEPNTSWLPAELLNEKKYLENNSETLRVDAAGPRVYAFGDVGSYSRNSMWDIITALPVLAVNLKRDLLSFDPAQPAEKPKGKDRVFTVDTRESQLVPIGTGGGVGALMGWKVPSWFVWALKGRDYMLGLSGESTAGGDAVKKEVVWTKEEAAI